MSAQPSLFDGSDKRLKKRGHVPQTSVEAGQTVNRDWRARSVTLWLANMSEYHDWPTSDELAQWEIGPGVPVGMYALLYIRRGLSDALAQGLVEHGPSRKCWVTGRTCVTWRVRSR